MGHHLEYEYEGFLNHLIYNCAAGVLPALSEMKRDLRGIVNDNIYLSNDCKVCSLDRSF